MTTHDFTFCDTAMRALPSGALYLPDHDTLCISDLHLGKSERMARRGGALLPPYENRDTLERLDQDLNTLNPARVICLGDSFDDDEAELNMPEDIRLWIVRMIAGRNWIWITGNHDPGPVSIGGTYLAEVEVAGLTFRHIAQTEASAEISGHYHPKFRINGAGPARAAFVYDDTRMILPAYGTFTGGLNATSAPLRGLFSGTPIAVLTGKRAIAVPVT